MKGDGDRGHGETDLDLTTVRDILDVPVATVLLLLATAFIWLLATGGTTCIMGDTVRLHGERERDLTTLVVVVVLTVRRPAATFPEPSTGPEAETDWEVGLLHGETDLTILRVILVVLVVTPVFRGF